MSALAGVTAASAFESDRQACRAAGMHAFLPEPWTAGELDDLLAQLVAGR